MGADAQTPAETLDERIAAAFGGDIGSSVIVDLIIETEAAATCSAEAAEQARTRALDPALPSADVAAARRDSEDAAFQRDRMREAVPRLRERLKELRRQEDQLGGGMLTTLPLQSAMHWRPSLPSSTRRQPSG